MINTRFMKPIGRILLLFLSLSPCISIEAADTKMQKLWEDYCKSHHFHSAKEWSEKHPNIKFESYPHIQFLPLREYTDKYIQFLQSLPNLEELTLPNIDSQIDIEYFLENLPYFPNLKALRLRSVISSIALDYLFLFKNIEKLWISNFNSDHPVDLNPLEQLEKLSKFVFYGDDQVIIANKIPSSVKTLSLDGVKIDPSDFDHLKLKSLDLYDVSSLLHKEVLSEIEFLSISRTPIEDLSFLINNETIKTLELYRIPKNLDLSPINTLKNLKSLYLSGKHLTNAMVKVAIYSLSNLEKFSVSECRFLDLMNPSFWEYVPLSLKILDLQDNSYCDMSCISRFALTSLRCPNTTMENAHEIIHLAPTLERLDTTEETFASLIDKYGENILKNFTKLKVLKLWDMDSYFTSLEFLKLLPSLEHVFIDIYRIPLEALDIFLQLKNLRKIEVTHISYDQWIKLRNLRDLKVPIVLGIDD